MWNPRAWALPRGPVEPTQCLWMQEVDTSLGLTVQAVLHPRQYGIDIVLYIVLYIVYCIVYCIILYIVLCCTQDNMEACYHMLFIQNARIHHATQNIHPALCSLSSSSSNHYFILQN